MTVILKTLTITAAACLATGAAAQNAAVFDMKGTWTGQNEGIVDGPAPHHPAGADSKPAGNYRIRRQTFTYKFEGQEGRLFWGTMGGEHQANIRILGSLSADGKWIYMVSKEGYIDAQILDADTIESCYRHVNERSAVVGCNVMKRQK